MSSAEKTIDPLKMTNPVGISGTIKMETRLSLGTISLLLIQVSLRPKPRLLRKTNATKKVVEDITQLLGSISQRWQKQTRIRSRTSAILNTTPGNKKAITPTSALESQKTSSSLGDLYVND